MEIIDFINDLRSMGSIYYKIWLPIIVRFNKDETVAIKLNVPLDISKSTYYRVINYGLKVFPSFVKSYTLNKNYSELILSLKDTSKVQNISKKDELKESTKEAIQTEKIAEKTKAPRKKSNESSYPNWFYEEIINFLNQCTGKNYKISSVINRKFITQRLNDGFTIGDFKQVIKVKSTNWLGSKMEQFLRPETLFSNKFESYLNENVVSNSPNSNLKNTYDQINIANEFYNNQG